MKTILVISMLMCISIVSFAQIEIVTDLKIPAIDVINIGTDYKLPNSYNTGNNPAPKNLSKNDAGVIMILSPLANVMVGDIEYISIRIKNFGTDTLHNIPVNFQIGSGNIFNSTYSGTLKPDSSANFSFTQTYQVGNQNFTIRAFTSLAGDTNMLNDTIVKLVTVGPAQKDVGVSKIILPGYSTSVNAQVTVKVMIKNYGLLTQTVIPVSYQRGLMPPNDEIWTGMLAPSDTVIYTFTNLMNVPVGDHFTMCSYTRLANDAYIYNDSICKSVVICNVNAAGNINGLAYPPCGYTSQYSVPAITNAISYNWVINPAAAGTISGTGTTVTITFSSNPGIAYVSVNGISATCSGNASTMNIYIGTSVNEYDNNNLFLGQNIPNPTSGSTTIEYNLPSSGEVKFEIINLYGQTLYSFNQKLDAGRQMLNLDLQNFSAGIYYYTLEFKGKRLIKKMVVNK